MKSEQGNTMAAYASEAMVNDKGRYVVVYAAENESGYWETTYTYDSADYAKATAQGINESLGLSQERVNEIVWSSMKGVDLS